MTELNYASTTRRTGAFLIDTAIVTAGRIIFTIFLAMIWFDSALKNFLSEFEQKFNTRVISSDPAQLQFIYHHQIISQFLLFILLITLLGSCYHIYLNSSNWQGTIGKKLLNIKMIGKDGEKLSLHLAAAHYFLSILPMILILYLTVYQIGSRLSIYQVLTASVFNFVSGIILLTWAQLQMFTKKRTTVYDLILKVYFIVSPKNL